MEKPLSPPPPLNVSIDPTTNQPMVDPFFDQWLQAIPPLIPRISNFVVHIDIPSVAASTVSRINFSVPGVKTVDAIFMNVSGLPLGLEVLSSYLVSADDTVLIPVWNATGAPIGPTAAILTVWTFR